MLNSDPPDHGRLRRLVNKAFTARRIERLRPRIAAITAGLLDDIPARPEVDLLASFAFPLPVTVIGFFRAQLAAKRREPTDDLLSALIATRDQADSLSEDELVSMAFLLLVAGHETTVNLIASGVLALLLNPAELARLRADPGLIGGAVEELLRYVAPVSHATFRCAAEPVDLGGARMAVPPESLRWRPSTLIHGLESLPVRLNAAGGGTSGR